MKISIVTPTFNEIENIEKLCVEIKNEITKNECDYEHIIIDNSSTDGTIEKIKNLASKDKNIKVIINSKNYGHIKSPFYGILQATGDACILMASDFQDPIELIPKYIKKWKEGYEVVYAKRNKVQLPFYKNILNKIFYKIFKMSTNQEFNIPSNTGDYRIIDKKINN